MGSIDKMRADMPAMIDGIAPAFVGLPFAERVSLANGLMQGRFLSPQLAEIWRAMIEWMEKNGCPADDIHVTARQLLQLWPEGPTADAALGRLLAGPDGPEARLVVMILSCRKYLFKAEPLQQKLKSQFSPTYIVVGDSTLKRAVFENDIIIVPAPDNYESLSLKVMEAIVAIRSRYRNPAIIKVDDDCEVVRPANLASLYRMVEGRDYVGHTVGSARFDRTWHIGKCENPSPPIYGLPFVRTWARGHLYFLGQRSVNALARRYLSYPGEFTSAFYEDKCVGDALARLGIELTPTPLSEPTGIRATD
jgi:hypothetical protein